MINRVRTTATNGGIACSGNNSIIINSGNITTTSNKSKTNKGSNIVVSNSDVYIDGEKIDIPKSIKTNTIVNDGKCVFVGGYQYFSKEKTFKRAMKAFFKCFKF